MRPAILWFRRDLRLSDNPAALAASRSRAMIAVYVDDIGGDGVWRPGGASRWWLHYSLRSLDRQLRAMGSRLILRRGYPSDILIALARETGADQVHWNRLYEPLLEARDVKIRDMLSQHGITVQTYKSALLYEPWEIWSRAGESYRVFSAFWRTCQRQGLGDAVVPSPVASGFKSEPELTTLNLHELGYAPRTAWDAGFHAWNPGEDGARHALETFLDRVATSYQLSRNFPAVLGTSRLSAHLHYGEISPRQVVSMTLERLARVVNKGERESLMTFLREIGWREFSYHVFHHFPDLPRLPMDKRFRSFPWQTRYEMNLKVWQRGQTGVPLVDAGMRELWATGWMHNRVRMITASFLTKNLLIPWQAGARWFWETLVDADCAVNSLNWQWVAGCGVDAAPYFRIFNPVIQAQRFDPKGEYIRRWVPELAQLRDRAIAAPWRSNKQDLERAGIHLGIDYPFPIVDLKETREKALQAYAAMHSS